MIVIRLTRIVHVQKTSRSNLPRIRADGRKTSSPLKLSKHYTSVFVLCQIWREQLLMAAKETNYEFEVAVGMGEEVGYCSLYEVYCGREGIVVAQKLVQFPVWMVRGPSYISALIHNEVRGHASVVTYGCIEEAVGIPLLTPKGLTIIYLM
jgi:hypothetical protein